jgi:C-terminal processing protease CtpA/Prc
MANNNERNKPHPRPSKAIIGALLSIALILMQELDPTISFQAANAFVPHAKFVTASNRIISMRLNNKQLSPEEEAERLKEEARKLREEIENFQQEKDNMAEEERKIIQQKLDEKEAYIDRYSAVVPILKPDGSSVEEKVQFPPRLNESQNSKILVCEASLPLGILLGESEEVAGMTLVDEVVEGSNAEAAGVKVGDVVRGFTACRMEMDMPTWQLIAGGIGRPKTMRFMYGPDGKPFEQVMEAIGSNRMDPEQRPVVIVLERAQEQDS